jgi:hypothetical protein
MGRHVVRRVVPDHRRGRRQLAELAGVPRSQRDSRAAGSRRHRRHRRLCRSKASGRPNPASSWFRSPLLRVEESSITGLSDAIEPGRTVTLEIARQNGEREMVPVKLRIDTPIEIDDYRHGGILPFVLRELMARR